MPDDTSADIYDESDNISPKDAEADSLIDVYTKIVHDISPTTTVKKFVSGMKDRENILIYNEMDKTKIFISLKDLGITGYNLDEILRRDYKIQVELSNYYGVLLIYTIGNDREDFYRLEKALEDLLLKIKEKNVLEDTKYPESIPTKVLNPREAFYSSKKTIKIEDSIGKISGEYIIPYPPGISLISPGEIITQEIIAYIQQGVKNGMIVSGLKDINLEYIDIIDIN